MGAVARSNRRLRQAAERVLARLRTADADEDTGHARVWGSLLEWDAADGKQEE